jgi:hypothetical protein
MSDASLSAAATAAAPIKAVDGASSSSSDTQPKTKQQTPKKAVKTDKRDASADDVWNRWASTLAEYDSKLPLRNAATTEGPLLCYERRTKWVYTPSNTTDAYLRLRDADASGQTVSIVKPYKYNVKRFYSYNGSGDAFVHMHLYKLARAFGFQEPCIVPIRAIGPSHMINPFQPWPPVRLTKEQQEAKHAERAKAQEASRKNCKPIPPLPAVVVDQAIHGQLHELMQIMDSKQEFKGDERDAFFVQVMYQLVKGAYLSSLLGVHHLNIKPENVAVYASESGNRNDPIQCCLKSPLGVFHPASHLYPQAARMPPAGSVAFMAPELLHLHSLAMSDDARPKVFKRVVEQATDRDWSSRVMWAVGMTVWALYESDGLYNMYSKMRASSGQAQNGNKFSDMLALMLAYMNSEMQTAGKTTDASFETPFLLDSVYTGSEVSLYVSWLREEDELARTRAQDDPRASTSTDPSRQRRARATFKTASEPAPERKTNDTPKPKRKLSKAQAYTKSASRTKRKLKKKSTANKAAETPIETVPSVPQPDSTNLLAQQLQTTRGRIRFWIYRALMLSSSARMTLKDAFDDPIFDDQRRLDAHDAHILRELERKELSTSSAPFDNQLPLSMPPSAESTATQRLQALLRHRYVRYSAYPTTSLLMHFYHFRLAIAPQANDVGVGTDASRLAFVVMWVRILQVLESKQLLSLSMPAIDMLRLLQGLEPLTWCLARSFVGPRVEPASNTWSTAWKGFLACPRKVQEAIQSEPTLFPCHKALLSHTSTPGKAAKYLSSLGSRSIPARVEVFAKLSFGESDDMPQNIVVALDTKLQSIDATTSFENSLVVIQPGDSSRAERVQDALAAYSGHLIEWIMFIQNVPA